MSKNKSRPSRSKVFTPSDKEENTKSIKRKSRVASTIKKNIDKLEGGSDESELEEKTVNIS